MAIRRPITPLPITAIGRVLVSGLVHGVDGILLWKLKVLQVGDGPVRYGLE